MLYSSDEGGEISLFFPKKKKGNKLVDGSHLF
jgi:hypothetical protein